MKRLKPEVDSTSKRKIARLIRVGVVTLLIIFFLEIWMVTRLSTYGNKIQEMKDNKANLLLENQILENAISEKSSLALIEKKALLLGFEPIKKIESIKPSGLASGS